MSAGTAPKKSDYFERLRKEIEEKFAAVMVPEVQVKPLTLDEQAEILFDVALRKMR
jgi:hypothetical protein